MTCKTVFTCKIYIQKGFFFPPFFSKMFERDTFMNSLALQLGKNNSWVQNSKSKNALPSMLKVNQMIYKTKPFQVWACFLHLTCQAEG